MPFTEKPGWEKNSRSSIATTAFCRSTGISSSGTILRFSMENSWISLLLRSKTLVVREGVYSSISYTGGRPEKM